MTTDLTGGARREPDRMMAFLRAYLPFAFAASFVISGAVARAENEALCEGARQEVIGGGSGDAIAFRLAVGGSRGGFLIDYGATRSSLSAKAFGGTSGETRRVALPFPGLDAPPLLLRAYDPDSPWSGIFGTDILSRLTVQLGRGGAFVGSAACDPKVLRAAGFAAVRQRGFFSADLASIDPARPNVPVVFVRIGAMRTWAQIDSGYADTLYPRSVDINMALYEQLAASGARLTRVGGVGVKTCEEVENRSVYAADVPLTIETDGGAPIVAAPDFRLILKGPGDCGGIGAMPTPAAQLGASFLDLFGVTILEPKAGIVWIRKDAPAPR